MSSSAPQNIDLFNLQTAKDLFSHTQRSFNEFYKNPDDITLLALLFMLNHLREWIAECNHYTIEEKRRKGLQLTKEEQFLEDIFNVQEFKIINQLCNRGKHSIKKVTYKTDMSKGAKAGLTKAGDSLSQIYYLVDDRDIRDIMDKVIQEYQKWF